MAFRISILPLGEIERDILDTIKRGIEEIYGFPSRIEEEFPFPHFSYNPSRKQYLSRLILESMPQPRKDELIIGIIDADLYAPGLNFVFGEASPSSGKAVIGLRRLREEFYGRPKNRELFRERALKEAIHEIGHLIGLRHCDNPKCVMFFSNTLKDTDIKNKKPCKKCMGE